jgi:hypothetical protein
MLIKYGGTMKIVMRVVFIIFCLPIFVAVQTYKKFVSKVE